MLGTLWLLLPFLIGLVRTACHSSCLVCSNPPTSSCLTCPPGQQSTNGACCKPAEYYLPGMPACSPCHLACTTCSGPLSTHCLTCSGDSLLLPSGTCACKPGTSGYPGSCAPCYQTCATCSDPSPLGCLTCAANRDLGGPAPNACRCGDRFFQDSQGGCQPCSPLCRTCAGPSPSSCTACESGAVLQSGSCLCNSTRSFQVASTGACFSCHYSCRSCTGPNPEACLSCALPSMLGQGGPGLCGCSDGSFVSPLTGLCSPCHPSCRQCSDSTRYNCTACYSSALVSSVGECLCLEGLAPSSALTCESCHESCRSCSLPGSPTACTSCPSGAELAQDKSCRCVPGYLWNPTTKQCVSLPSSSCHPSCLSCSSLFTPSACLSCRSQGTLTSAHSCACLPTFSMDTSTWTCKACTAPCVNCLPGANGPSKCASCGSSTVFSLDSLPASPSCFCVSGPGTYLAGGSTVSCGNPCSVPCRTCQGTSNFCTSCYPLASLSTVTGTCACPSGYSFDSVGQCVLSICPSLCLVCSSSTVCTFCISYAQLSAGTCSCTSGYYPSSGECLPCPPGCGTCTGPSTCTSCLSTSGTFTLSGGQCLCLDGYYKDPGSGLCLPCSPYCSTCTSARADTCVTCAGGGSLVGAVCVCPPGKYRNSITCSPCHFSCKTCSGPSSTDCRSCKGGVVLLSSGTCQCKVGFYMGSDGGCNNPCHPLCRSCSGGTSNNCLSCHPSALLSGNTCTCTSGYTLSSAGDCTNCHPSCLTCLPTSTLPNACTTCRPPATLSGGVCVCPPGKYMDSSYSCQPCASGCGTCKGPLSCTSPAPGVTLYSSTMLPYCSSLNEYWDSATSSCQSCHSTCASCKGPSSSDCLTCAFPSMKYSAGTCTCQRRYVWEANACQACHLQCDDCISALLPNPNLRCTSCKQNEVIAATSSAGIDCDPAPGFTRNADGYCYPTGCPKSCRTCSGTACTSCLNNAYPSGVDCYCNGGYGWNVALQCEPCNVKCFTCSQTDKDTCTSCRANTQGPGANCACLSTFYFDYSTNKCLSCHSSCLTCSGGRYDQCLSCPGPTLLTRGVCGCGTGKYLDATLLCQPCANSCLTCVDSATTCTSCKANAALTGTACLCDTYYIPDPSGTCQYLSCHPSCATCSGTGEGECTSCADGYLRNGYCLCLDGEYKQGAFCAPCSSACWSCDLHVSTQCVSCQTGLAPLSSSCSCPDSTFPSLSPAGECVQPAICPASCPTLCSSPTQCTKCLDPLGSPLSPLCVCSGAFYFHTGSSSCQPCHPSCLACSGPLKTDCTSCSPDKEGLTGGQCTCVSGQVITAPGTCQACHPSCLTCSNVSPQGCLVCKTLLAVLQADYSCKCRAGTRMSSSGVCETPSCALPCATCSGVLSTQCLTCKPSGLLQGDGTCRCPPVTHYMDSTGTCVLCHPSCSGCTGGSLSQCLACRGGATLSPTGTCVCTTNQSMDPNGNCLSLSCHFSCATCNGGGGATDCLTCRAGAVLDDSRRCVCLIGSYMDALGACLSCHGRCLGCTGPSPTSCDSCRPKAFLDVTHQCQCQYSYSYPSPSSTDCTPVSCHPSCLTCFGPGSGECVSCRAGEGLASDHTCRCLANSFPDSQGICQPCHSSCLTCSSPLPTSCITCKPNAVLTVSGCRCLTGYYSTPSFACLPCHLSCLTCLSPSPSSCTSCKQGASLLSSTCSPLPGFLMDPTTGLSSHPSCHPSCLTCSSPSPSSCLTCKANALLQSDHTCLCLPLFKPNPRGNCEVIVCSQYCLSCADPSSTGCLSCRNGAQLQTYPQGSCGCRAGLGYDSLLLCKPCFPNCKTCLTVQNNTCIQCQSTLDATPLTKMPDSTCQCEPGLGYSLSSRTCSPCSLACKSCLTLESNSCLTCKSGNTLLPNNTCACTPGLTLTAYGTCSISGCDYSCLTCSGLLKDHCLTCRYGAYLTPLGTCACRSGSPMGIDGQCILCHPSCAFCRGPARTECISCYPLASIQPDGQCLCKAGYYFDEAYLGCLVCDLSCLTCSGKTPSSCTLCREGAYLTGSGTCLCTSQIAMAIDGSCLPCPTVCRSCRADGRCATCWGNAELDAQSGCRCMEGYYMAGNFQCEECHEKCASCTSHEELACVTCKEGAYYNFYSSSCDCTNGTYYHPSLHTCTPCTPSLHCAACNTSLSCTLCPQGFNLTGEGRCEEPVSRSGPFNYSVRILHDQIFLQMYLEGLDRETTGTYVRSVLSPSLLHLARNTGEPLPPGLHWSPIPQSEFEWARGLVRFRISISESIEAFNSTMTATPALPVPRPAPSSRLLEISPVDSQPKEYLFPTFSYLSPSEATLWKYLSSTLYSSSVGVCLFLVLVRPLVPRWRATANCFWLVRASMWLQLLMLSGFLAVEFRGSLDGILGGMADSSLRWFGLDTELSLFPDTPSLHNFRNGYYVGKYTGLDNTPSLMQRMLVPSLAYLLLSLAHPLLPRRLPSTRAVLASMRAGVGMGFGVQFMFLAGVNWVAFFGTGVYTVYSLAALGYSLAVVGCLCLEVGQLKGQLLGKTSLLVEPSTKAILAFDLEIHSDVSRRRLVSRVVMDEPELLFLSGLLVGLLGRQAEIQSALLAVIALWQTYLVTVRAESEGRMLVRVQNSLHLVLRLLFLGYSFTRRDNPVKIVKVVGYCLLAMMLGCMLLTLLDLCWRIWRLYRPFTEAQETRIVNKVVKGIFGNFFPQAEEPIPDTSKDHITDKEDLSQGDSRRAMNTDAEGGAAWLIPKLRSKLHSVKTSNQMLQMDLSKSIDPHRANTLTDISSIPQNTGPELLTLREKTNSNPGRDVFPSERLAVLEKEWEDDLKLSNREGIPGNIGLNLNKEPTSHIRRLVEGRDHLDRVVLAPDLFDRNASRISHPAPHSQKTQGSMTTSPYQPSTGEKNTPVVR